MKILTSERQTGCCLALIAAFLVGGCTTVGPDFNPPEVPEGAPDSFRFSIEDGQGMSLTGSATPAWSMFEDPVLIGLIERAYSFDPSLEIAEARLAEARALLGVADASKQPTINVESNVQIAGETVEQPGFGPEAPSRRETGDRYRLGASASFELDLWGRLRRVREAAGARAVVAEADFEAARQVVAAEVARAWFTLQGLRAEAGILDATIANRSESLALREADFQAGRRSNNDAQQALVELRTMEAERKGIGARISRAELALDRLCGPGAHETVGCANDLSSAFEKIRFYPTLRDQPAEVLRRRPDVAAAEAAWHASVAEVGVAMAERYPDLRLDASAGFDSLNLGDLIERPSQFWQTGPSLYWPVFTGGRIASELRAAEARAQLAAGRYRQTIVNAVHEIEVDLSSLQHLEEQGIALGRAVEAARDLVHLSQVQYESGFGSYLEVVESERSLLSLLRSDLDVSVQQYLTMVDLIRNTGVN